MRFLGFVVVIAVGASFFYAETRVYGIGTIAFVAAVFATWMAYGVLEPGASTPLRRLVIWPVLLVGFGGVLASALALAGMIERQTPQYVREYGTEVTARINPDDCSWTLRRKSGLSNIVCGDSSWSTGSETRSGTVTVAWSDDDAVQKKPDAVRAWAYGGQAYTAGVVHEIGPDVRLGRLPGWKLLVGGLACAVLLWVLLAAVVNRASAARQDA